jgi:hypothetical protein
MAKMKKIKYHNLVWWLSIYLLLPGFVSNGQQNESFKLENVIESIVLNTDRDIYFAGEELFFSAEYFINGLKVKPLISNVIYVEVINCTEKNPVVQGKYEIIDFNANGTIKIPNDIPSGNYVLRAYTQYQRNFGALSFSYHFITILNPENNKNLFTIGKIADTNFSVKKTDGDNMENEFPKTEAEGIQTQIKQKENGVEYLIHTKGLEKLTQNAEYKIKILSMDLSVNYSKNITLGNASISNEIPEKFFKEGTNYVVLTNPKGGIENINTMFFKSQSVGKLDIDTEKERFVMRENVNFHISVENNSNSDLPIVSVAVVKHGSKKEDHIVDRAIFAKDPLLLRDYLNNNPEIEETTRSRILVKFDNCIDKDLFAKQIQDVKTPSMEYIPEIRSLTLGGILRNKETLQNVPNHNIYLSVPFNYPQLHICKTADDGSFIFSLNNVRGINDVFLCPENADDGNYEILITNPFSNEIPHFGEIPAFIDSSDIELINEMYVNAQINQSFYATPEKESQQRVRRNTFNIDNGKSTILLSDFVTLKNMEELFTEIVPTAKYRKSKGQYSFAIFDLNGNVISENPLLLLDKIPVFDANKIMGLNISLIEKVEVINKNYILGENTFNGVILLTTKTENFAGIDFPKSSIFIEYPTIENSVENTRFSIEKLPVNRRIPDFRTTLFWEPNIQLSANATDINFQTSDNKGTYDIVVKGYSSNGQAYFGRKQIIVE